MSHFTREQVLTIRRSQGTTPAQGLADLYGCSTETIRRIWRRETFNSAEYFPEFQATSPVAEPPWADRVADSQRELLRRLAAGETE